MGKKGAREATGDDIRNFLTQLAVKGRVSIGTQTQALNALVFLLREALGREPGELSGYVTIARYESDRLD